MARLERALGESACAQEFDVGLEALPLPALVLPWRLPWTSLLQTTTFLILRERFTQHKSADALRAYQIGDGTS